jgi:heme/copper-type cytochrome/quinol oxidase subunit 2
MSEVNIEGNTGAPTRKEPDHIRRVLTIWVVLSIVGIVIWGIVSPYILPPSASDLDSSANFTFVVFTDLSIPVALFVFVFLCYSLLVFRVKERPTEDAIPLKPRPGLQIGWMGVTRVCFCCSRGIRRSTSCWQRLSDCLF